jgi:hypothetical protein
LVNEKNKYEVPEGENVIDFLVSKGIDEFFSEKDSSAMVNQHFEYGKNINTNQVLIREKNGQDNNREYSLPFAVSEGLKVFVDGVPQSVGIRNIEGETETVSQFNYEYNSNIVNQSENEPTIPTTSIVRFEYKGLSDTRISLINEDALARDSINSQSSRAKVQV